MELRVSPVRKSPEYKVHAIRQYQMSQDRVNDEPKYVKFEADFVEQPPAQVSDQRHTSDEDTVFLVGILMAFAVGLVYGNLIYRLL